MGTKTEVICPDCGSLMVLRDGQYGKFWGCSQFPKCEGAHSAHPDGTPLGIPANKETKNARIQAHAEFDRLWRNGPLSRRQAYRWLQGLPLPDHIAEMSKDECAALIEEVRRCNVSNSGKSEG